jgi:hypothetical protein
VKWYFIKHFSALQGLFKMIWLNFIKGIPVLYTHVSHAVPRSTVPPNPWEFLYPNIGGILKCDTQTIEGNLEWLAGRVRS